MLDLHNDNMRGRMTLLVFLFCMMGAAHLHAYLASGLMVSGCHGAVRRWMMARLLALLTLLAITFEGHALLNVKSALLADSC
jgi:hypothetical protein